MTITKITEWWRTLLFSDVLSTCSRTVRWATLYRYSGRVVGDGTAYLTRAVKFLLKRVDKESHRRPPASNVSSATFSSTYAMQNRLIQGNIAVHIVCGRRQ